MSFAGPEVARAVVEMEVVSNNVQIAAEAQRAAQVFSNNFQKTMGGLEKAIAPLKTAITATALGITALTAASVKLGASFAKTAGNFQELEQSLNAIITNSKTARTTTDEFIKGLRQLAIQSGRSSEQLANTGRQLLALGFSGARATEILTTFSKAASLTGATNRQLELALNGVSQIASKGVVSMEELRRQIAENLPGAVNLARFFEILGQNMGVTTEEARKLQEQGKVTADIGIQALIQTVNEATEGIDVFALRARTLNGILGIMREVFQQAVQTGFKPFVEEITKITSGPLGEFIGSLTKAASSGGGGVSALTQLIERFAKVLGTSFRDILNEIIPLIPQLANLFVTLVEAFAPIVVDVVRIGSTLAKILVPALTVVATAARVLFNDLGPLSFILRQLATGAFIGGLINSLSLFGRALGSIGGLLGRVATPMSKLIEPVASLATRIGAVTAALGFLEPIIAPIATHLGVLVGAVGLAVVAFKAFHIQQRLIIAAAAFQNALSIRSAAVQAFAAHIGRMVVAIRTAIPALFTFRNALLATGIGAAIVLVTGLATAFLRLGQNIGETLTTLREGVDVSDFGSLELGLQRIDDKITELEKKSQSIGSKIIRNILGTSGPTGALANRLTGDEELGKVRALEDEFKARGVAVEAIIQSVANKTGKSFDQIKEIARQAGIDFEKVIPGDKVAGELATIDRVLKAVDNSFTQATDGMADFQKKLQGLVDDQEKLVNAQKAVRDAEQSLIDVRRSIIDATEGVARAQERLVDANEKLAESHEDLAEINRELAELEAERLDLINDTARDIRELQEAEHDLARAEFRLLDLDQERINLLEELAELQAPATAEEIAKADRKLERGKIALAKAIREEAEFLRQLNEEQKTSVDLSNLSLDDLRTTLAGLRAQAAAQRNVGKTVRSQEEINEEIAEHRLSVLEAEANLNELQAAREELNNRALTNAEDIERVTRRIERIEFDRISAINAISDAQLELNNLRAGETSRAKDIKQIDDQIATTKDRQKDAVREIERAQKAIVVATREVRDAEQEVRDRTREVRDAEFEIRIAKNDQKRIAGEIFGIEEDVNAALRERLGIFGQLAGPGAQDMLTRQLTASLPALFPNNPFVINNPGLARQLADAILNNPNRLRELLRSLGSVGGFEQGGLITSPTLANIGEHFKHEMVLPLTKPDRVWSLLSQNLPRYPGALRAAQAAISQPVPIAALPKSVTSVGARRAERRDDGPATYGQLQELINLLRETKFEQHVEAPITVNTQKVDEDLLARKMSRRIERDVLDKLSRR